jgi:aromatic ring-opening dioxygenase catalytic subunit (LigB family)
MISSIFVCHGGPTLAIDNNEYSNFLKELGRGIKRAYSSPIHCNGKWSGR